MKNGISVVVCCYNSESKLPQTLDYLANQKRDKILIELIVVDNNSNDNTFQFAKTYWSNKGISDINFKVIQEKRPGLSFAREAGVNHSSQKLILFCDDDNWLDNNYCQLACEIMAGDGTIGILGGMNTGVAIGKLPHWFSEVELSYACGPQNKCDGEVTRNYITGAGMVLRKTIFQELDSLNFESKLTDRKGEELSSGGDSELCFVAILLGYKLAYSSQLMLEHFMDEKRLNWNYFIRMSLGHADSGYKLRYYFDEDAKKDWSRELVRILRPLIGKRIIVLVRDYFYAKRGVVNGQKLYHMSLFSQLLSHLKMYGHYAKFIAELDDLKSRIKHYRLNKSN